MREDRCADGLAVVANNAVISLAGQKRKSDDVFESTHTKRVASIEVDTDMDSEREDESPVSHA